MSLQLTPFEQVFLIERDRGKSATLLYTLELCEDVESGRLKKAAEIAAAFYPRMHEKPVLDSDGRLILCRNDAPPPVFEKTDRLRYLGSADTNAYLYDIQYCGRMIKLTFSHAVADWNAAFFFIRQLMYEYFRLSGEDIPAEGLVYTSMPPAEHLLSLGEAIERYENNKPGFDAVISDNIQASPPVRLCSDFPLFGTPYAYAAELTWDNDELVRAVKGLNATPFSFFSAVIAHTVTQLSDTDGRFIRESCGYSLRKLLNVPSQCFFTVSSEMSYKTGLSAAETVRVIREKTEENAAAEKLIGASKLYDMYANMLISKIDMRDIVSVSEKLRSRWNENDDESFYFANLGVLRFPERVQEKIRSFGCIPNPQKKVPDHYSYVFKGVGTLRTVINSTDERILPRVSDILREYGVNCSYRALGKLRQERVDVLRFERTQV